MPARINYDNFLKMVEKHIPKSATWVAAEGELYGGYNWPVASDCVVSKVLYCVTPTEEVQKYFRQNHYDLLISHHPFLAGDIPQIITHTALDCCEGGLNDLWRDHFGLQLARPICDNLGWHGFLPEKCHWDNFVRQVRNFIGGPIQGQILEPLAISSEGYYIHEVAICTGLGGLIAEQAAATGAPCFVTGECVRPLKQDGFQSGLEVGHTLSERMGVKVFQRIFAGYDVQIDSAPLALDVFGSEVYTTEAVTSNMSQVATKQNKQLERVAMSETSKDCKVPYNHGFTIRLLTDDRSVWYDHGHIWHLRDGWLYVEGADDEVTSKHAYPLVNVYRIEY